VTGAEALIETARRAGIEVCFANPGTTELPFVAALDSGFGLRTVLGLFEGVCTGAADGYARMRDRPALTLLHLGPGLANGLANLHNARRARSPVVNLVGDHATWHRSFDAPLTSDIAGLAATVSTWVRAASDPDDLVAAFSQAVASASAFPGAVATLIVPADCLWGTARGPLEVPPIEAARPPRAEAIAAAAAAMHRNPSALLLGGRALRPPGLRAAAQIRRATGCRIFCETFPARFDRDGSVSSIQRLPYFPEAALAALEGCRVLVLAGAREPVAFFGYPNSPSRLVPADCTVVPLARDDEDPSLALEQLAAELGDGSPAEAAPPRPSLPPEDGPLAPESLCRVVAALQPQGAIVVDEGATTSFPYFGLSEGAPPHTVLTLTGGAIGQGGPCATGAAIACPERPVISLQADGSALYTVQALWTQAREGANVKTVLCVNDRYRILEVELGRAGISAPGPIARGLTRLDRPNIDWVALARGFGVPSVRVRTVSELVGALRRALAEPGPQLLAAEIRTDPERSS
jgi:acetolactate synthase-1/2/3 large subunit